MPQRDAFMSVIQGDQATLVVRTWRDSYLTHDLNLHTSVEEQIQSVHADYRPSRVYTEAFAMVESIAPAVAIMADVACAMADDVDETVWGTLAEKLCEVEAALEDLLEDMGLRRLRTASPIATSPVQAVRRWAAAVQEEEAGMLPSSTLHLETLFADIVSVVSQSSHRLPYLEHNKLPLRLFEIALSIAAAASSNVVRNDADATVPVSVSDFYCEELFCIRTDGLDDVFVCYPASSESELGLMTQMRLCPQHQNLT